MIGQGVAFICDLPHKERAGTPLAMVSGPEHSNEGTVQMPMTPDATNLPVRQLPILTKDTAAQCDRMAAIFARMLKANTQKYIELVDSPIEQMFLASMVAIGMVGDTFRHGIVSDRACYAKIDGNGNFADGLFVIPQARVDKYRVDFLLVKTTGTKITKTVVVELDGHNFHERTKEQSQHDKARDRHFAAKGWFVLRFTGAEVSAHSERAVLEAFRVALSINAGGSI